MRNIIHIANLLNFLIQSNHWQHVLRNNDNIYSFYHFSDIQDELVNNNNTYPRYFRIYINHPNTSILIHRIYCPDQKYGPAGIIEPTDSGIWLGYFRFPENFSEISGENLNEQENNLPRMEIRYQFTGENQLFNEEAIRFINLLLLELAEFLINNDIWNPRPNRTITLGFCTRCF
jgi:hypothetical protein